MKVHRWLILSIFLVCAAARAHVGSPDVYAEGQAGNYHLSIVIRPPSVIPGVADVEIRTLTPGVERISITPVPLTGEASKHPPTPDLMRQSMGDTQFFTGHLWIMTAGSWQIRSEVSGTDGQGTLSIPFAAAAMTTRKMERGLGVLMAVLGVVLVVGMIGIVGAAAREVALPPDEPLRPVNHRHGRIAMVVSAAALAGIVLLGDLWWKSEATVYSGNVYKPLKMRAELDRGKWLNLKLEDTGWLPQRKLDDFIPDHDHIMHLYLIRWPQMDVAFHLHPEPTAGGFRLELPTTPAGTYRLYADVVHANGFPETIEGSAVLPAISARPLSGDDAEGSAPPLGEVLDEREMTLGPRSNNPGEARFDFPDGYAMVWKNRGKFEPRKTASFNFQLLDRSGQPASDVTLYMGMLGHAAFVKTDGSVFAHIHPNGTMAMAAFMMANDQAPGRLGSGETAMNMAAMPGMQTGGIELPATVHFPYGFPSAGSYRVFVQMKHGTTVETGVFDAICLQDAIYSADGTQGENDERSALLKVLAKIQRKTGE